MPTNPNTKARLKALCLLVLLATAIIEGAAASQEPALRLVLMNNGALQQLQLQGSGAKQQIALPADAATPLGSLWKLWVYTYLADGAYARDRGKDEEPYTCQGNNPEEVYCCSAKGETLQRDQALAKSCGLYFDPVRLKLDASQWRRFWHSRATPAGLEDLANLRPNFSLPIPELLRALADLPAQNQARQALLAVMLAGDPPYVEQLGSSLRVKTWSWRDAQGANIGGFAGWLQPYYRGSSHRPKNFRGSGRAD
mgnify:CR=1 FL=1